jgi:hypothetical protein
MRTLWTASGAVVLAAFCLISGFSIGLIYAPAAALLLVAVVIGMIVPPAGEAIVPGTVS